MAKSYMQLNDSALNTLNRKLTLTRQDCACCLAIASDVNKAESVVEPVSACPIFRHAGGAKEGSEV